MGPSLRVLRDLSLIERFPIRENLYYEMNEEGIFSLGGVKLIKRDECNSPKSTPHPARSSTVARVASHTCYPFCLQELKIVSLSI